MDNDREIRNSVQEFLRSAVDKFMCHGKKGGGGE
jgi:hypothetical protein